MQELFPQNLFTYLFIEWFLSLKEEQAVHESYTDKVYYFLKIYRTMQLKRAWNKWYGKLPCVMCSHYEQIGNRIKQ